MTDKPQSPEDLLTLEDVAALADRIDQLPHHTVRRLGEMVRAGALFPDRLREVRELAEDAGLDPDSDTFLTDGLALNRDFDRLLAAEGWKDPAEVLDPEGVHGVCYPALIHIAARRADRADDSSRLLEIHRMLQCAATLDRIKPDLERLVDQIETFERADARDFDQVARELEDLAAEVRRLVPEELPAEAATPVQRS